MAEILPVGIRSRTVYLARDDREFYSIASALDHNEDLDRADLANEALRRGATVYEAALLNARFPSPPPEVLKRITAKTPLIISHWQCRDNPGYCVGEFSPKGIYVSGDAGSWSGSYGNWIDIRELACYAEDTLEKHPELTSRPAPLAPSLPLTQGGI